MLNFNFFRQKSPQQRFLFILGLFAFLIYMGIGVVLLTFDKLFPILQGNYRLAFAILLIVYAIFRFGRVIYKRDDENED